jgi:hypothetical protein
MTDFIAKRETVNVAQGGGHGVGIGPEDDQAQQSQE